MPVKTFKKLSKLLNNREITVIQYVFKEEIVVKLISLKFITDRVINQQPVCRRVVFPGFHFSSLCRALKFTCSEC